MQRTVILIKGGNHCVSHCDKTLENEEPIYCLRHCFMHSVVSSFLSPHIPQKWRPAWRTNQKQNGVNMTSHISSLLFWLLCRLNMCLCSFRDEVMWSQMSILLTMHEAWIVRNFGYVIFRMSRYTESDYDVHNEFFL